MTIEELAARASTLAGAGERALLGIAGPPGAGKSTLAVALVAAVGPEAALVPMDGFHLADFELRRLGRRDRKGAIDTFDAAGYVHLLRRVLARAEDVVYAPQFVREQELAVAGALPVPREARLVVTEGNYLLADGPFREVRQLLTECWYVDVPADLRHARLTARHMRHGRAAEEAESWALGSDERNAALVQGTRDRADLLLELC